MRYNILSSYITIVDVYYHIEKILVQEKLAKFEEQKVIS